jgi:hypothetical protein
MQCKELEAVLEQEGLSPLPFEARAHVVECASCQDLIADLSAVVVAAKRIPAEVAPPDRIWISLRAQLEAEGIIRGEQPLVVVHSREPWWHGFSRFLQPRALATVCAGVFLVFGSLYLVNRPGRTNAPSNSTSPRTQVSETPKATTLPAVPVNPVVQPKNPRSSTEVAGVHRPPKIQPPAGGLKASPSEDASFAGSAALLSETEDALPSRELANNAAVDASLRQNLRTLNEFIAECEARLKQNPQDQLTREYLSMAYQQKAELLNAMMDSGRSEH